MFKLIRATLASMILVTVITGLIYPLVITGIAKVFFPVQAEGSLIDKNGNYTTNENNAVGSALIGQTFDQNKYFWGRLSATENLAGNASLPYNAASSSGSNLGPSNPQLLSNVNGRIQALQQADPSNKAPIPVDLVTSSGSGLDPDESIAAAEYQLDRVAAARKVSPDKIEALVQQYTTGEYLGFMGEKVVNVLELNLALDREYPAP
jgi:potassium-transporting ATPase KdpC subunit